MDFPSVEGPCADDVVVTLQPFFFLFLGTLTFFAYWALVELLTDQHEPSPCIAFHCGQGWIEDLLLGLMLYGI